MFYNLIIKGFAATPVADIKLELPNDYVWLHYIRNLQKVVTLQFMSTNKLSSSTGISDVLTKADVAKLFGKTPEYIARVTTENFYCLFKKVKNEAAD